MLIDELLSQWLIELQFVAVMNLVSFLLEKGSALTSASILSPWRINIILIMNVIYSGAHRIFGDPTWEVIQQKVCINVKAAEDTKRTVVNVFRFWNFELAVAVLRQWWLHKLIWFSKNCRCCNIRIGCCFPIDLRLKFAAWRLVLCCICCAVVDICFHLLMFQLSNLLLLLLFHCWHDCLLIQKFTLGTIDSEFGFSCRQSGSRSPWFFRCTGHFGRRPFLCSTFIACCLDLWKRFSALS